MGNLKRNIITRCFWDTPWLSHLHCSDSEKLQADIAKSNSYSSRRTSHSPSLDKTVFFSSFMISVAMCKHLPDVESLTDPVLCLLNN